MKKHFKIAVYLVVFLCLNTLTLSAQESNSEGSIVDLKYLEDQLYLNVNYNILNKLPEGVTQTGFSWGVSLGFIRDIPLNKPRTIAFGIGLGYAYNTLNHNLKPEIDNTFSITSSSTNNLKMNSIEIPLELRFRNSNPIKKKFLRAYLGLKLSYTFTSKYSYDTDLGINNVINADYIKDFQYGLYSSLGYGNLNLYTYYSLTPLFKESVFNGNILKMNLLSIGLSFYIL